MDKLEMLYESVISIIGWAIEQGHISHDAAIILEQNISSEKERIKEL